MKKQQTGMNYLRQRMAILNYHSLQEAADAVGCNRGNLWRWFNLTTTPGVDWIPLFAEALDTTILEILIALEVITPSRAKQERA